MKKRCSNTDCDDYGKYVEPKTGKKLSIAEIILTSAVLSIWVVIIVGGLIISIGEQNNLCTGCIRVAAIPTILAVIATITVVTYKGRQDVEVCGECKEEIKE